MLCNGTFFTRGYTKCSNRLYSEGWKNREETVLPTQAQVPFKKRNSSPSSNASMANNSTSADERKLNLKFWVTDFCNHDLCYCSFFLSGGGLPDVARVPLGHCPMCNPECPLHPSNTLFDWLWLALIWCERKALLLVARPSPLSKKN